MEVLGVSIPKENKELFSKVGGKDDLLIQKLISFYSNPKYLNIFIKIVEQGTLISLRLLDWFSTNYSKYKRVYISNVDIHSDYKNQLKGYKKMYFDPFCRRGRILLMANNCNIRNPTINENVSLSYKPIVNHEKYMSEENGIITTVGQLNFFKWCIEKKIINYIIQNITTIEKSMFDMTSIKKSNKKENEVIKPTKPNGNVYKTIMHVTVKFN